MKLNRIAALVLALLLCFAVFCSCGGSSDSSDTAAATDETTQKKSTETYGIEGSGESDISPALWRVRNADTGAVLYLFGTIHVCDESMYPLPEAVLDAYRASDSLAVEFNISAFTDDKEAQVKMLTSFVYTDGSKITDHLPAETYNNSVRVLSDLGVYNSMYDFYNVALWYDLVTAAPMMNSDTYVTDGVDTQLTKMAERDGKEILEIETAESQYNMLNELPEPLLIYLMDESIKYIDNGEYEESLAEMCDAWKRGNLDSILEQDEADLSEYPGDPADVAAYEKLFMSDRNALMVQTAASYLQSGKKVFYAVGAAHMTGADGIVAGLTAAGYTVEPIPTGREILMQAG